MRRLTMLVAWARFDSWSKPSTWIPWSAWSSAGRWPPAVCWWTAETRGGTELKIRMSYGWSGIRFGCCSTQLRSNADFWNSDWKVFSFVILTCKGTLSSKKVTIKGSHFPWIVPGDFWLAAGHQGQTGMITPRVSQILQNNECHFHISKWKK